MRFRVKGVRDGGAISQFDLDAESAATAKSIAVQQGWRVLSVLPVLSLSWPKFSYVTPFSLTNFSQELLALLEGGLGLIEALSALARKERRAEVQSMLHDILGSLRRGETFSTALARFPSYFPNIYIAAIQVSEQTSDLKDALRRYINYAEQFNRVRDRVKAALVYPTVLIVVGALVVAFLLFYVIPRFAKVYDGLHGELPFFSSALLSLAEGINRFGPVIGAVLLLLIGGLVIAIRDEKNRRAMGSALLRLKWLEERFSLMQQARMYRTLGMLLRGGIPILAAGAMVEPVLDSVNRARLKGALAHINEGRSISEAMENAGLTTPIALGLLAVGERGGQMGDAMERIASFHDEEMARWVDRFVRLFEPLLMTALGLIVGIIVVLMYMPIFELAGATQ